jgi:hypothetical protein
MSARSLALSLLLAAALASTGCAAHALRGTVPPLGIQLGHGTTEQSFRDLVRITRDLGYPIEFADAEYGVFGARSRLPPRRGSPALSFVVQCFADGRATLTVIGAPAVAGTTDVVRVPDAVRREAVALAQALEERRAR